MRFHLAPVSLRIGAIAISAHTLFESLGCFTGFRLYLYRRSRVGDFLSSPNRLWMVTAAIAGAAIGSKVLGWFEHPVETLAHYRDALEETVPEPLSRGKPRHMSEEESPRGSVVMGILFALGNLFASYAIVTAISQTTGAGLALLGFGFIQIPGVVLIAVLTGGIQPSCRVSSLQLRSSS